MLLSSREVEKREAEMSPIEGLLDATKKKHLDVCLFVCLSVC